MILYFDTHMDQQLGGRLRHICEAAVIILAIIAQLASVGYKIAIEKDWIVIIAAGDSSKLASGCSTLSIEFHVLLQQFK